MGLTAVSIKMAEPGRDGSRKKGDGGEMDLMPSLFRPAPRNGAVSSSEARRAHDQWAYVPLQDADPITERQAHKEPALVKTARDDPPPERLSRDVLEVKRKMLRGEGKSAHWPIVS